MTTMHVSLMLLISNGSNDHQNLQDAIHCRLLSLLHCMPACSDHVGMSHVLHYSNLFRKLHLRVSRASKRSHIG